MYTPTLETKRLILRPMKESDATAVYENWTSDPLVARYMVWTTHENVNVTKEWLSHVEKHQSSVDSYDFIIICKSDNVSIGSIFLGFDDDCNAWCVGYSLARFAWGLGYATESLMKVLTFGIEELGIREFEADYSPENAASGAILKKCGFTYVCDCVTEKFDGTKMNCRKLRLSLDNPKFKLSNGLFLPAIGFGSYLSTVNFGEENILKAFASGYRYIDTAFFYHNEEEIGKAIKASGIKREELFLTSKVWPTRMGKEETEKCFEESLNALGTDYLDMYLIHWPKVSYKDEAWKEKMIETWRVLEKLYKEGKIKIIGLSNFLPHHIEPLLEVAEIKPMVDQLELHAGYMQAEAVKYLKRHGIVPQAWSPLGRGALLNNPLVTEIAAKYGKTNAQILLRYLFQKEISVIPKASSEERMVENKNIFDFFLQDEDVSKLNSMPETGFSGEHPDTRDFA